MKKIVSLVFLFIFHLNSWGQVFEVIPIFQNGETDKRINFVYMGDGYTAVQQGNFVADAQNTSNAQFDITPYKEYKNFFNSFAVKVISNESGTDHPQTSSDSECTLVPIMVTDTYFDSTFDYYGIHRLLVPNNYSAIYNVLSENTPYYDQANIIVNSSYYGGSGGGFATASTHTSSSQVMIHEIGHSFIDLADEYWAGSSFAMEKANMTQETNSSLVKWKNWLGDEGIGIYPYGSSIPANEWFRPHQSCVMRQLGGDFCAVCREATIDKIYSLINPIDNYLPVQNNVVFDGTNNLDFSVDLILPNPNTIEIEWLLDSTNFATGVNSIVLTDTELTEDTHELTVNVEDTTELSRTYTFASGYLFSVTWNIIEGTVDTNENEIEKFFYKIYPNPSQDVLYVDYTSQHMERNFSIFISDTQGKRILTESFLSNEGEHQFIIDIYQLEIGLYTLNIESNGYTRVFTFIKE